MRRILRSLSPYRVLYALAYAVGHAGLEVTRGYYAGQLARLHARAREVSRG